jgi:N-methylhydantoinase A
MSNSYRVSADIGGTFTDIVIEDLNKKELKNVKVLSTPENPANAVVEGLKKTININEIVFIVHGTTVGLNAFLERKGSKVLLLMTKGVSDSFIISRGDRKELYNVQYKKQKLLISRSDVVNIEERLNWSGEILKELNYQDLDLAIEKIEAENIPAIAICFIHSYVNPIHELEAKKYLQSKLKNEVEISLSHELAREWREHERASTAIMNSYIGPVTNKYLRSLKSQLGEGGYSKQLYIMQSNGGIIRAETAIEQPVKTLLSGPVGGTIGGVALSNAVSRKNLVCVDMGGTSFDMSLIIDGKPSITNETELEHLPLLIPLVDIHTIGAGGGSLTWLENNAIRVGPQSAGANPGPACYGKGGEYPTVTDANLFLGRLGKNSKLGGWMQLDVDASEKALSRISKEISMNNIDLAEGIISIINAKMADAIRTITVKKGIDPRDFSLVSFGGAGSMHAVAIAEELEMNEVIVPNNPGTFSAWGMLQTDIRKDLSVNFFNAFSSVSLDDLKKQFELLKAEAIQLLEIENVEKKDMSFFFNVDMRYIGQEYYVNISIDENDSMETINKNFHETYLKQYGHSTPSGPLEFINIRLIAEGFIPKGNIAAQKQTANELVESDQRNVVFKGKSHTCPVYERTTLPVKKEIHGPCIIEEETSTTVIPPGYFFFLDDFNNLFIQRKK